RLRIALHKSCCSWGNEAMTGLRQDERSVFLRAIEIPSAEERAAFLEAACGNNQQLRAEVEALLRAHENHLGLLGAPDSGSSDTTEPAAESPGTMIGSYKLLQQIGEGGMGIVFMAEQQEPVRRRVALKIIKPALYDAGTIDGTCCLVSEFIQGATVA